MTTDTQLIDVAESTFSRQDAGQDVALFCRGLLVASFRRGDSVGRNVAIASLIRVGQGLKTDTIAELCDTSHGSVCHVRKRLADGGMDRVVEEARRGAPRKLTDSMVERLRDLHADNHSVREIAEALGVSKSLVGTEIKRLKLPPRGWRMKQQELAVVTAVAPKTSSAIAVDATVQPVDVVTVAPPGTSDASPAQLSESDGVPATALDAIEVAVTALEVSDEPPPDDEAQEELVPGARLASGPAEHACRYAGTLLLCAAAGVLGVFSALDAAHVTRPADAVYDTHQVFAALLAAWGAGYGSLEAMHERDARAMGVILGLERSPSVRTMHRAIAQMSREADAIELNAALMRGVLAARLPERLWFGLDGHFKAYTGDEPIDKGWDSKRRLASKGLTDVTITDVLGFTWSTHPVSTGSALSQHLVERAHALRRVVGNERPIVVTFDRGGFDFDVLDALDRDGFYYAGYIPGSVTLPDLSTVAPTEDGAGEVVWRHGRLHHHTRLLVERDGTSLIPMTTNLPTLVETAFVVEQLRAHRGAQENSFKAARAFAHIDRLVDQGGASRAPDDRLVPNPARAALKKEQEHVEARIAELAHERPAQSGRSRTDIYNDRFWVECARQRIETALGSTPAKVPHMTIEPDAQRAQLKTSHRLLLQPLKYAADNARRWLLGTLGAALAPSTHPDDLEATARTLLALIRAPGTVRIDDEQVIVTLELPLAPTPHARLASALRGLDVHVLLFTDGRRRVRFRLAPRPTRADIPGYARGAR